MTAWINCPVGLYLFALVTLIREGWTARKDFVQVVMENVAAQHFLRGLSLVVRTWRHTNFRKVSCTQGGAVVKVSMDWHATCRAMSPNVGAKEKTLDFLSRLHIQPSQRRKVETVDILIQNRTTLLHAPCG